jgi:hypothetical protein
MTSLRLRLSELWRFLRSTPRAANLFALATLALWLFKSLYLDFIPGFFPAAHDLGRIVEGILSAIIAGWVFYLFFALLPEARQKSHVAPFVLRSIATIVGDTNSILQEIARASGETLSFSRVSEQRLTRAFAQISFDGSTTLLVDLSGRHATWPEFFRMRRERTKERISEIKELSRYVEPEVTAMILSIGHNGFFTMAETAERFAVTKRTLSSFAPEFFKYLLESRELAAWHDANLIGDRTPLLPNLG